MGLRDIVDPLGPTDGAAQAARAEAGVEQHPVGEDLAGSLERVEDVVESNHPPGSEVGGERFEIPPGAFIGMIAVDPKEPQRFAP